MHNAVLGEWLSLFCAIEMLVAAVLFLIFVAYLSHIQDSTTVVDYDTLNAISWAMQSIAWALIGSNFGILVLALWGIRLADNAVPAWALLHVLGWLYLAVGEISGERRNDVVAKLRELAEELEDENHLPGEQDDRTGIVEQHAGDDAAAV